VVPSWNETKEIIEKWAEFSYLSNVFASCDVIILFSVRLLVKICPCSPVDELLGCHVRCSVTCVVAVVRRFNPSLGVARRIRLLKNYFVIITMHMMIRAGN